MGKMDLEKMFENLVSSIGTYNKKADVDKIKRAWEFCKLAHSGQKRKSGDPYASHPLAAALILTEWKVDTTSIIAALLHDTIEDGGAMRRDIVEKFGEDVALLVDGVTKVSDLRLKEKRGEASIENLRKLVLVMAKDLRVVLVKLADRLHNMRTLSALSPEKQRRIARETMELYAPLAERMGIGEIKGELEDLCFPYLHPPKYLKVSKKSEEFFIKAEKHIAQMKRRLKNELRKEKIESEIHGRKKHLYSLWKKLERDEIGWDFNKLYDIVALRIIVGEVSECYVALGIVHKLYKPIPNIGVSDFIAQPKPNGYQSIHTKVFGPKGRPVEVRIRTHEMHKHAEYGFAAHWAISELKSKGKLSSEDIDRGEYRVSNKLSWVKELLRWQEQLEDIEEYEKAVKFDALAHRNFVFSPKGDVYDLPSGATPIDFVCAVHTGMIRYVKAAKVNGKIVPLDYKLQSGDVVEIVKTRKSHKPYQRWLEFVVTHDAKRSIRKNLRN